MDNWPPEDWPPWWAWVAWLPLGLGAWAAIVPGMELRRPYWIAWGAVWSAVTLAGMIIEDPSDPVNVGVWLILLGWVGSIVTTQTIRPGYARERSPAFEPERKQADSRLRARRKGMRLPAKKPELAREIGIGRPDLAWAEAADLVDVNNAPVSALVGLPGIDDALATRIVELRAERNGFTSLADLRAGLELDGYALRRLPDRVVFLPR